MSRPGRFKGTLLIHIDERRRDLAALLALAELFQEAGVEAVLSARRTTPHLLREVPFDAVLVPSLDHIPRDRYDEICRRSKVFMLPSEGAIFGEKPLLLKYGGGYQSENWNRAIRGAHRFLVWGEYSRRVLEGTGRFRKEQLKVVGAPRMDFFLSEPSAEEKAGFQPGAIGTISNFILTNSYNRFSIFEAVNRGRNRQGFYNSNNREVEDRFWQEIAWIRVCLELFDRCQERGMHVRLRIHPREDFQAYRYLERKYGSLLQFDDRETPFEAWLENLGLFIGCNSTTFFEAVAANKPSISLEGLMGHRLAGHVDSFEQNHYRIMDQIPSPASWDAFLERLDQARKAQVGTPHYGREAQAILKEVCSFPRPVSALAAIVQEVLGEIGEGRRRNSRPSLKLAQMKSRVLEFLTFSIRRDSVVSSWFPLDAAGARRRLSIPIRRYLQAAKTFPAVSPDGAKQASGREKPLVPVGAR